MKNLLLAWILVGAASALWAQEIVERIDVVGNARVSRETILYYVTPGEGDLYDEAVLRKDFRVLWSTGFFADIRIESEPGERGRIVTIIVEENPVIREIAFKTGDALKEGDIIAKLKEKDETILPYSYYSPFKIQRIKRTVEELLAEKGFTGGQAAADLEKKSDNEVGIVIRVLEGGKARVGEIIFDGSPGLSSPELLGAMKGNRKHGLLSRITGKDTFRQDKLQEDLASLKKALQDKGYMEALIGEPRIEEISKRTVFMKKRKMVRIIIPVQAGERYAFGEVAITGNRIVAAPHIRSLIKLEAGETYSARAREKAVAKVGEIYRNIGHLYAQIVPVENLDPKAKRVNLSLTVQEGEAAYLNRLEFSGNTFTKDKVMRRELLIREGDRFFLELFKNSVLRLKQLGLVDVTKDPDIRPDPDDPTKIDVTVNVQELQKNNIQFSAGYSGYDGTFVSAGYSTVNLLGTGESLNLMAQYGKRTKNFSLGFTKPYFLELPINVGLDIHKRSSYYPGLYQQDSRGVSFTLGARVKGFWNASATYGYEYLNFEQITSDESTGTSAYNPYYYGGSYGYGNYHVGSMTLSLYRNTVDSPLTPSRGSMYMFSCKLAGGPFGGEIEMIKPQIEWTQYIPVIRNHVIGLHVNYEFVKPTGNSGVPFWERFYLGGERSIRGYEIYSIGPLNSSGANQGGEKSLVVNLEYIVPIGGAISAIAFHDAGNAFTRHQNVSLKDLYSSTGLEMRIFVPALRVPFRLIFAYNHPGLISGESPFAFRFAIGTTF
jgi:outer membrane protein insertion porin family